MDNLLYREESYNIRGALFAVFNELGCGYLERVYQDALEVELRLRNIPYEREKTIQITYKGSRSEILIGQILSVTVRSLLN